MKNQVLFCSISNDNGTFSVHYKRYDNVTNHHKTGYSLNTFSDCPQDTPVICYNLGSFEDCIKSLKISNNHKLTEYYGELDNYDLMTGTKGITLNQYLDKIRELNIPVIKLRELY